jgi:uncharacterized protein YdaU (DUF1376 family)
MPGLSRFDFYPRDWHLDTRDLTNAAKGIYIDLLASIYARGAPLPHDEHELCRICGCATVRSLRPLLRELLDKQKLRLVDGHLTNGRAMEEIAKAERRGAIASSGGTAKAEAEAVAQNRAEEVANRTAEEPDLANGSPPADGGVQPEFGSNSARTRAEMEAEFEEKQGDNSCSPSPSPSIVDSEEDKSSSAASAAFDPEKPVYDLGKTVLGKKAGGQVTSLIRLHGGDLDATMQTLRLAARKSDAREYVGAILRGERSPGIDWGAEYRRMGVSL